MQTLTHEKWAAALMKSAGVDVNMRLIKNVNHDVDNSPGYVMAISQFLDKRNKLMGHDKFMGNPTDMFGLMSRGSHRQHGHDILSGMFIAMQNARALGLPASRGMLPVVAHYMADNVSNKMAAKMGTPGRDLFEALFNYQTRRNRSKTIF